MNKAKVFIPSLLPLFAAAPASATIIHFDDSHAFTVGGGSSDDHYWDINTDETDDVWFNNSSGGTYIKWRVLTSGNNGLGVAESGKLLNLSFGDSVSAGRGLDANMILISSDVLYSVSGFTSGVSGYVGFTLDGSSDTHYGWARVTLTDGGNSSLTVHEWAYNDVAGAPIQVGTTSAVPEPAAAATGLGLLALGAAGLRRSRSRKQVA